MDKKCILFFKTTFRNRSGLWLRPMIDALGRSSARWSRLHSMIPAGAGGSGSSRSITKPTRTPWSHFPDAVIHAPLGAATKHPDYAVAKAGSIDAALRLVRSIVSDHAITSIQQIIGHQEPVIVSVHANEAISINPIPQALAIVLAKRLNLDIEMRIVQAIKVSRTGADGFHRIANSPTFFGDFPAGRPAILVDDTLTQGGTFASLKGHIEQQGGTALLATTLTGKQYSAKIALTPAALTQLRDRYGDLEPWWRETFGYDFACLTESEARYLINSGQSADHVRNRILAAKQA